MSNAAERERGYSREEKSLSFLLQEDHTDHRSLLLQKSKRLGCNKVNFTQCSQEGRVVLGRFGSLWIILTRHFVEFLVLVTTANKNLAELYDLIFNSVIK